MTSTAYEFIPLDTFGRHLKDFQPKDQERVKGKISEMLSLNPYRYPMLSGNIPVAGLNVFGLRHLKVGVSNAKGGAYVLYRICEECKKNGYYNKSDAKCGFCDDNKSAHVVLYDVRLRSHDYGR